jgi:curved DNA-binding protein CbpA
MPTDPVNAAYAVLGVSQSASDDEVRSAYRRLVKLHHPDHNAGSPDAARRFEGIQDAYARVTKHRSARASSAPSAGSPPPPGAGSRPPASDHGVESRLAQMEREVRAAAAAAREAAEAARERARADARDAVAGDDGRPSDEELGYYSTDDSFGKIFRDARTELADRFADAREQPLAKRLEDLLDDFERRARP